MSVTILPMSGAWFIFRRLCYLDLDMDEPHNPYDRGAKL